MPTVLPKAKDINLVDVSTFDGSPANLSLFDTQVRNALKRCDIPAYNGGTVIGNDEDGFAFCATTMSQSKSNYLLGEKLCAGLSNKFSDAAAQWWDDYDNSGKPAPNCWKKALNNDSIPSDLVEVSLYDLLIQQFDPAVDAQQAELELEMYKWNPMDKNGLAVVPFRGHINRLCTRAGKTTWSLKGKTIRNTFPDWLKKQVKLHANEDDFWKDVAASVNTEMMDRIDKVCPFCQKSSHTVDECRKREPKDLREMKDNGRNKGRKKCIFCGFEGHEVEECRRMKTAQQQLPAHQQEQQAPPYHDRQPHQLGYRQHQQFTFTQPPHPSYAQQQEQNQRVPNPTRAPPTCYNCQRQGDLSIMCPEPRRNINVNPDNAHTVPSNYTGTESVPMFAFSSPAVGADALAAPTTLLNSFTKSPEIMDDLRLAEPEDEEESDSIEMLVTVPMDRTESVARLEMEKRDSVSTPGGSMKEAIIIGVDFGTTFSGVAWCYTGDPNDIRTIKSWPSNNRSLEKVPSVIQYGTKDSTRFKWGFEVTPEAPNPLRWFKLLLNEQGSHNIVSERASSMPQRLSETHSGDAGELAHLLRTVASLPSDKTPLAMATDYLTGIYQHTRDTLANHFPKSFTSSIGKDIGLEFCLTVPAIWTDAAKDLTLQAARAAGMNEAHVRIKTVSEPEAAAVHCLKTFAATKHSLKVGDVYVIADCGGGTVDLVSYEITSVEPRLRVDECVGVTGGLCGSTALNRRFQALVKRRLGITEWENMSKVARFNTIRYFDEHLKPIFCPAEYTNEADDEFEVDSYHCPVPGVAADPARGIHGGYLILTAEEMKGVFEPTFLEITALVQQQVSAAETKTRSPVTGVLLVGGFGSSRYLREHLSAKLKRGDGNSVKVLQPPDAWSAIARGAVSYALSVWEVREGIAPSGSGLVVSRVARFSYGVSVPVPFVPGLHPSSKMYYCPFSGRYLCRGMMQWFVKKNERIPDGKNIEVELEKHCPTGAEPEQLVFSQEILFCDLDEPPKEPDSKDVRHLLTFTADLNDISRRKHFIRKKAAHGHGAYFAIPLSMSMEFGSACLNFSLAVGGKTMGKGSVSYDHGTPQWESQLE